ncbi:hypothetical protein ACUOCP_37720 [Escherichia sp. R-CC3]
MNFVVREEHLWSVARYMPVNPAPGRLIALA